MSTLARGHEIGHLDDSSESVSAAPPVRNGLMILRDWPVVGPLEWALTTSGWNDETDQWAANLSAELFGICDYDVDLDDSHFPVLRMYRDEADAYWASHGWDVTDENGKQLLCMEEFTRPMVCMVERLHPDAKFIAGDVAWGAKLEAEAKRFKASR